MEPPQNSQENQQLQRRALRQSTTPAFPRSHSLGLTGSETSPKTRESCSCEPTLNGHHDNCPHNSETALPTARKESKTPPTALDLRHVIYPPPRRRAASPKRRRFLDHFPAVIRYVWESRFAERSQIQRRFSNQMASDRTAQYQLESLTILGYLGVTIIRGHASRHRYVYFVKKKGLTLLAPETMPKRRTATEQTRSHGVSDPFLHHELLITEANLLDWITVQRLPHFRRLHVERRYFNKAKVLHFESNGKTVCVKPDSGAMIEIAGPDAAPTASIWFKEIDRGTESFRKLKTKFRAWDGWSQSVEGEEYLRGLYADHGYQNSRPTFKLQVIAHANSHDPTSDTRRLVWLFTAALSVSPRMRRRLYFTTVALMRDVLRQEPYKRLPAAAPIWWRLRDASSWLEEYKEFVAELPEGMGQKPYAHMRRFIAERLPAMPQHSLFPSVQA